MVERLRQIPEVKRELYQRAMLGRDRKAAMDAYCLECCGWVDEEVFLCTDPGCPLYPYRPQSKFSEKYKECKPNEKKSKNSDQLVFNYG
jgi:hypothetical protein